MSRKHSAQAVLPPAPPPRMPVAAPEITPPQLAANLVVTKNYDVFGTPALSKQAIRERAYQIYLARNGAPGDAAADWLAAETELREELARRCVMQH